MTTPDATREAPTPGLTGDPHRGPDTDNLHRELAPITAAARAEIEEEARRTFRRNVAGRRVVDVPDPGGPGLAAVGTSHDATGVQLSFQETLTFRTCTDEAVVVLEASPA